MTDNIHVQTLQTAPSHDTTKQGVGQNSHFVVLMKLLQDCLLCHQWQQANSILSSLCLYPLPDTKSIGHAMPTSQLIWKCGIEMIYNHPSAVYTDITQFHDKRQRLDSKVPPYQSCIEHVFYLLSEQRLEAAHEVIKKMAGFGKQRRVHSMKSKQAKYETTTLRDLWKDIVTTYTGVIEYMLWYETGSQDTKKDVAKYYEKAVGHLDSIKDTPGVWDVFITKHIELLCSQNKTKEAVEVVRRYQEVNPDNPNGHRYLYQLMKRQGATTDSLTEVLKDVVDRIPSDELVLEYVDLLRQKNKHCHDIYLPHLFNMLDYACWKHNVRPWQALAERLRAIHIKKSANGLNVMRSCCKTRQGWWPDYHFGRQHALQIAKQDKQLAVHKAMVAIFILSPDCVFVKEIVTHFTKKKKRKCLKRINRAKSWQTVQLTLTN